MDPKMLMEAHSGFPVHYNNSEEREKRESKKSLTALDWIAFFNLNKDSFLIYTVNM